MNTLPASIAMGSVMLRVADLDAMTRYYSDVLGLKLIAEDVSSRVLGGDKQSALVLISAPELKHAGPSEAGLFYTALIPRILPAVSMFSPQGDYSRQKTRVFERLSALFVSFGALCSPFLSSAD